jgi:predicted nucleic acid-binding protein
MKVVLDSNIFVSSFFWKGNVDFIITGDDDLLILEMYKAIKIVKPRKYLDILENI